MKIVVDENKCSSLGMCEAAAPAFFEVGDNGELTILDDAPGEEHRALVEEAVAACPTNALSIQD